jgi:hypothetical protein
MRTTNPLLPILGTIAGHARDRAEADAADRAMLRDYKPPAPVTVRVLHPFMMKGEPTVVGDHVSIPGEDVEWMIDAGRVERIC